MNNSKSYKNIFYLDIDAELVIRNMIFLVLFCIIVGMSVNYFLWPMIEAYQEQHIEEKKVRVVFLQVQKDFNLAQESLRNTKNTNKKPLNVMSYDLDRGRLRNGLDRYFSNVEIVKKDTEDNEETQFKTDIYYVSADVQNIEVLNRFFDELKIAPMSMKILLPIVIEKMPDSDRLIVKFYINIKKSNFKSQVAI
ncbi:hypothetical protein [Helicobacter sp. 13S00477-4]|uniref:hypothetical protein n=1 Tax=Helicobacter sp. 13S00477-4 TaxID=1905759 RepID=UPI000BA5D21F|nr:hypothetical protein [Helicobacter sp. 13S00477-4]PAF50510.1 hypothetical protein BKH44_07930 [Helicobacter sp. 13S00477-4]